METARADGREWDGQQGRVRDRDRAQEGRDTKRRQIRDGMEHLRTRAGIFGDKFSPKNIGMMIFGDSSFSGVLEPFRG